ncbi:MAG: TFIIB-type zinc ribbon-containing protein [Thermoproteota archaeon]
MEKHANKKFEGCGEHILVCDEEHGELFCARCGCVIQEKIAAEGPEWRTLDSAANKSRIGDGSYLSKHDMGLSTVIGPTNKDVTGKPLSANMRSTIERLRMWDNRSQAHNAADRNLRKAFSELLALKEKLGLSDAIVEDTAYIYRKAHEKKLIRGRPISAFICAALYAACRDSETPRTIKDIQSASAVKSKQINKCYRQLVEGLDMRMPVVDPVQCVSVIANKVGTSEKTKRLAASIFVEYEKTGNASGKSPMAVAATAVYLAAVQNGESFTQRQVARAASITEVTIRNRTNSMRKSIKSLKFT